MVVIYNKNLKEKIFDIAQKEGLSDVGFTNPKVDTKDFKNFKEFIKNGFHGQMNWLNNNISWRENPKLMWKDVKTVIVFAESYYKGLDPMAGLKIKDKANISVYARGEDYHNILKKKLKIIAGQIIKIVNDCEVKVFVDTAPIMEKSFAQKAGIGWQGKHTNILSKKLGNWIFLGLIFTNIKFEIDEPEKNHCGNCDRCLKICPTNAFVSPFKLDATKCISYLTIEHKGPIDLKLRPYLGNRIFGCDDCLAVCPWNKFSKKSQELKYSNQIIDNLDSEIKNSKPVEKAISLLEISEKAFKAVGSIEDLEIKLKQEPNNLDYLLQMAIALFGIGKIEDSFEMLLKSIEIDKEWNEQAARKQLLEFFSSAGIESKETISARKKLAILLFS